MKIPNRRRIAVLSVIALLLAAMTTGNLTICDVYVFGPPSAARDLAVTVEAGQTAGSITGSVDDNYVFRLCQTTPVHGVYPVVSCLGGNPCLSVVDLVTSPTTPPGDYIIQYAETYTGLLGIVELARGELRLTVTPSTAPPLDACFEVYQEILKVGEPVAFYAYCSTGAIAQFKWWFNYNGNPSSTPDLTTTDTIIDHTFTTMGQKTVRLVVRTATGEEDEVSHAYTVNP